MDPFQSDLYFKIADTNLELEKCFRLRYDVYCNQKKWLSPSDYPNGMETDEYDKYSLHILVMNEKMEAIGTTRFIKGNECEKLPYRMHPGMKGVDYNGKNQAEVSRLLINTKTQRLQALKGMLRMNYQACVADGIENWVFVLEASLLRLLSNSFKFICRPLGRPANYYGGITMAAYCDIRETERSWKKEHPDFHEFYNEMVPTSDVKQVLV